MNLRTLAGIFSASALVAGGLLLAPSASADTCNDGAIKPDGGGADGYYTCFGREWIHTVPFHDPNSADGYGPNQTLPPICIRMPKDNPCPTGTSPTPVAHSRRDDAFLRDVREDYYSHSLTDEQLLAEGYRICDAGGKMSDESIVRMPMADLGLSITAAASLVGSSRGNLGC